MLLIKLGASHKGMHEYLASEEGLCGGARLGSQKSFWVTCHLAFRTLLFLYNQKLICIVLADKDESSTDSSGQNDYATVATGTFVGGELYFHLKAAESFFLFFGDLKSTGVVSYAKQETSKAKQDEYNEDHSSFLGKTSKLPRRQLRGKRRENHTVDSVKQDYDVTVKLENEPIQRSKSVDSAVMGKYSLWRKQNENENSDSNVRTIQDQMIMARVYISLAITKNKLDLVHELQNRLRDSQRSLGEATTDAHLHRR
ncbi:UNVERIFIED_CONTAM: Polygalacturonate 4-alpha-galacturonosyltransferase [Sesamum radiatum]|uniref:Polygalacturonate 4-alpha-galacturonosyltransferase n=1 Tax=Sesamum radiatum TaxID=300843 RepID=A0AAW2SHM0_SESRA